MKQSAVEWLIQELRGTDDKGDFIFQGVINSELIEQAIEMEKQQCYSEEEVELIANEMVNWAIDNIGNPNPQSGKKFDEVMAKFKNK
jgi:hypothetical protein